MISKIMVILLILGYTSAEEDDKDCLNRAVPKHSTAGVHFVVAFPYHEFDESKNIHLITYHSSPSTIVHILEPDKLDVSLFSYRNHTLHLPQFSSYLHEVQSKLMMPLADYGFYPSIIIKSNLPIKVHAFMTNLEVNSVSEVYVAMPEQSCYQSYYVTTPIGFPSIMVFSFKQTTTINLHFPSYKVVFYVACGLAVNCAPSTNATFMLSPYRMWFFLVQSKYAQLQNTLITSDKPIFVVSGSGIFTVNGHRSIGFSYSSMTPTVTWGKEHFVPNLYSYKFPTTLFLKVNSKTWPLNVKVYNKRVAFTVQYEHDHQVYQYKNVTNPIVATAIVPFGMYLIMPFYNYFVEPIFLSVIPTEQWMAEPFYISSQFERYYDAHSFQIATRTMNRSKFNVTEWKWFALVNGWNYFYTYVDLRNMSLSFSHIGPSTKSMLYIRVSARKISTYAFPHDHYQGDIYNPNCVRTKINLSDGVDNDCDNTIDEEILNQRDDDGDGLIDEDSSWQDPNYQCHNKTEDSGEDKDDSEHVGSGDKDTDNKTGSGNKDTDDKTGSSGMDKDAANDTSSGKNKGDATENDWKVWSVYVPVAIALASLLGLVALYLWYKKQKQSKQRTDLSEQ